MRRIFYSILISGLIASVAHAQERSRTPTDDQIYCNGIVTTDPVPADTYVITGADSNVRMTFSQGKYVFINKGSSQGVKVGDEFQIVRPTPSDYLQFQWFQSQDRLLRAMGTTYEDEGHVRVVDVQPNVSTAQIVSSCMYVQRGDIAVPFVARPAPPIKEAESFDRFAPTSGKAKAMVVTTRYYGELAADGRIVYVNLGSAQGVKVGDYFRVFRYQGNTEETVYQTPRMAYQVYGFGAAPRPYTGAELPRDVLGEGVVLRVSKNAATVLITFSATPIYPGDYVELE
ncbi:MAG TPA: FlgT C-terminal domain-containing protein [Candidatus Acidoferrales bacterium]|jgi:hypothetical protein|nr:FlgT C-terminal domain-containing protein [Candidatus Acidoferrales bacterium]